ncbi:MAG: outer membrane beta-barrel protein [Pseudomonadota bacterium]
MVRITLIALLMLVSISAIAQDIEPNDSGFAFVGMVGVTELRDEDTSDTFSGDAEGISVDFEWRILRYLSAGMIITDFGEAEDDFNGQRTTLRADGFGGFVRGMLPVTERFVLHARVGRFAYNTDLEPGGGSSFIFSEDADFFGVGFDIRTSTRWSIRVEHQEFDGQDRESGRFTGIGFRFQL